MPELSPNLVDLTAWSESETQRQKLQQERLEHRGRLATGFLDLPLTRSRPADPVELFLFCYDKTFYDRSKRRFRLEEILDEGEREFGGYDLIVLWQPYPRMGICPRTQWDYWSDLPGGLPALREMVAAGQQRGVRFLLNYIRWDAAGVPFDWVQGAPEDFAEHGRRLAELLEATGADGIYGDTISLCPPALRQALEKVRPGAIFESEYCPDLSAPSLQQDSWTQGVAPRPLAPPALRWLEPRFRFRFVNRGTDAHDWLVAQAVFWGTGVVVWENVFGWWNPYRARARAFLRKAAPLLRAYAKAFEDPGWEPLAKPLADGVHGNRWTGENVTVITLLNENTAPVEVTVPVERGGAGRIYDAWNGRRLVPEPVGQGILAVRVLLEPRAPGLLAVAASDASRITLTNPSQVFPGTPGQSTRRVFDDREAGSVWVQHARDGAVWNDRLSAAETGRLVEETGHRTRVGSKAFAPRPVEPALWQGHDGVTVPDGMIRVPGGRFVQHLRHLALWREGGCSDHPNELRHEPRYYWLRSFFLDRTAVSQGAYRDFLAATAYTPADLQNFLLDWVKPVAGQPSTWRPAPGRERFPVTWVDPDDARAYARWAKRRLPREEEWQRAAQGDDGRPWPWGSTWDPARCAHGRPEAGPVEALPEGAGPYGHRGLAGHVWEWTESERDDGHTRYILIRGGSHYTLPTRYWGKMWYAAEGALPCDAHEKFLLLAPGLDRCANIGFRCAADPVDNGQ